MADTWSFRRNRRSRDGGDVRCYLNLNGRITLKEFLEGIEEHAGDMDPSKITINTGQIIWEEPASQEELDSWASSDARSEERSREWRRKQWQQLKEEFEDDDGLPLSS